MRQSLLLCSVVLSACSCSVLQGVAHADTYNFQLTSTGSPSLALSASGTLTTATDATNPQLQDVVALSGTLMNGALTGNPEASVISLIPAAPGTTPSNPTTLSFAAQNSSTFYLTFDNVLDPTSTNLFDGNGLAFRSADGISYVVGYNGTDLVYEAFNNDIGFDQRTFGENNVPLNFSLTPAGVAATPEPASIALLGTGLLAVGVVLRRRRMA